jgi:hypothetical protein
MSYTLYYFPYSICSIMVRYTIALRGPPRDEASAMSVTERVLDITAGEQTKEEYLCEVNPKGQVCRPLDRGGSLHGTSLLTISTTLRSQP